jgi:hypothetical protein
MSLKLSIDYDHASGLFEASLENGTRFKFTRNDIGGKLENALTLYRRAVVSLLEDKPLRKSSKNEERQQLMELSAGRSVSVVGVKRKKEKINLDSLEIEP